MKFDLWTKPLPALAVDCLVVGVFEGGELSKEASALDLVSTGRLKSVVERGDVSGRTDESLLLVDLPRIKASRVLITGLGSRKNYNRKGWRKAMESSLAALTRTRVHSAAFAIPRPAVDELNDYEFGRALSEIVY